MKETQFLQQDLLHKALIDTGSDPISIGYWKLIN